MQVLLLPLPLLLQAIRELHHFFLHNTYRRIILVLEDKFGLASARTYPSNIFVVKYQPELKQPTAAAAV
jgi:hypothetical protein